MKRHAPQTMPSPAVLSRFSAWLPVACLALTTVAFGMGAPAKLARRAHRASSFQGENVVRDEPIMFPMAKADADEALRRAYAALPLGSWRGIHDVMSRPLVSSR